MSALFGTVVDPKIRAAIFAVLSTVLGARAYLQRPWKEAAWLDPCAWPGQLQAGALLAIVGLLTPWIGAKLVRHWPRCGLALIEARILWVLVVLAAMVTIALLATDALTPVEGADAQDKAALGAIEKAVAAVIAALTVAIVGESSASAAETASRAAFHAAFKGYPIPAAPPTDVERAKLVSHAVFSDPFTPEVEKNADGTKAVGAEGWGFLARWSRARTVAVNLK